jgi:hypothetical protein
MGVTSRFSGDAEAANAAGFRLRGSPQIADTDFTIPPVQAAMPTRRDPWGKPMLTSRAAS